MCGPKAVGKRQPAGRSQGGGWGAAEKARAGDMGWAGVKEPQQVPGERSTQGPVPEESGPGAGREGAPCLGHTGQSWGWGIQRS